jgi:hypothetical protein
LDEIEEAVHDWLAQQLQDFFFRKIYAFWNFGGGV